MEAAVKSWARDLLRRRVAAYETARRYACDDPGGEEPIHDVRVASRRLRAALELFGEAYDKPRKALRRLKRLGKVTGELRDAQLHVARVADFCDRAPDEDRKAVRKLSRKLRRDVRAAEKRVRKTLARVKVPEP